MVYLDNNATTPLDPLVFEEMRPHLEGNFGNPSSIHALGRSARAAIDDSRERFAAILRARPHEIIFTSGGTEACNLAVLGIARAHAHKGRHIITAPTEHHAVLHACEHLHHNEGFDLTLLPVDRFGRIDPDDLASALRPDTVLVTLMHANNETGTIHPIREIGEICRARGVFFHTDAVQSFGKIPADLEFLDAASFAAHKFYGPKGSGALWLRSGIALSRLAHGGAHENSRRPGTENPPATIGLAKAAELSEARRETDASRLHPLSDQLEKALLDAWPGAFRNGDPKNRLANTVNFCFPGADGEALLIGLDLEGIAASSGSACMVGSLQASHVLLAMGVAPKLAASSARFSLGKATSAADISAAAEAVRKLRGRFTESP